MPYKLPSSTIELPFPVRWRRGVFLDVDPEHAQALAALGGIEISREAAVEVSVERPAPKPRKPEPTSPAMDE